MMKYYDSLNNKLVFTGKSCGDAYWDRHWRSENFASLIKLPSNRFITKHTQKYLAPGAKILEGGCGRGDKVYALFCYGYDAYGVDCAKETVERIKRCVPELKVSVGDVRNLQFADGFFDGYWSLGVIEHFYEGYDSVLREMHRVLTRGGYLFLTVPVISWLRKQKVKLGKYPEYKGTQETINNFYQFAFEAGEIISGFEANGFKQIEAKPFSGIKGLKDEVSLLKPILQWIYDSNLLLARVVKKTIDVTVRPFANHMVFFVFQKV